VGTAQNAPLPTSALLPRVAAKFFTIRGLQDGNRKRRRAFYTARETSIEYAV
jgi:hypothetical protein